MSAEQAPGAADDPTLEASGEPGAGEHPATRVRPVSVAGRGDVAGAPAVRAWVREREAEIVELLGQLVAIDSTTGREDQLAHFCADWLRARGVQAWLQPCKGRHNVIASVPVPAWPEATPARVPGAARAPDRASSSGAEPAPALVLSGHLDTVPAEAGAWPRDPHHVLLRDGRLHGLGASDLKASIAAAYFAQLYLLEQQAQPGESSPAGPSRPARGRLLSVFTIEEETTGDGTREFLDAAVADGLLDPASTAAIITEPTGLTELCVANAAPIFVELVVRGRGGHGSRPHLARNPAAVLGSLLAELPELERSWAASWGDREFPELARPTLTPTSLGAGDPARHNVIPERASCVLDVRVPEALYANDFRVFRREFEAWIERFRDPAEGLFVEWSVRNCREGHRLDPHHELVETALCVLREDLGLATEVRATTAGNDAVFFGLHGIPAINKVGPGHPECAHRVDEFVSIANVLAGTEFFIRVALAHSYRPAPGPRS